MNTIDKILIGCAIFLSYDIIYSYRRNILWQNGNKHIIMIKMVI